MRGPTEAEYLKAIKPRRYPPEPIPTLWQLQTDATPKWLWLVCQRLGCNHRSATPLAPWVIRYGPNASSSILRERTRCLACGHKGAATQMPAIAGGPNNWGFAEFPATQSRSAAVAAAQCGMYGDWPPRLDGEGCTGFTQPPAAGTFAGRPACRDKPPCLTIGRGPI